jgi:uncharacterized protein involved in cysteine biosynthesis
MQQIKDGMAYTFKGMQYFLNHRELWKYSVIPVLLLIGIYALLLTAGFYLAGNLADMVQEWCRTTFPSWLQWLTNIGSFLIYLSTLLLGILLIGITAGAAYETVGGPFLDVMLEKFETDHLQLLPVKKSFSFTVSFALSIGIYGIKNMLLTLLMVLLTLFFPYITLLLGLYVLGYRFGIAYLAIAGFSRGMTFKETKIWAKNHPSIIRGYGMMIYVLLCFIPILAPVILPGIILGGSLLLHDYNTERNNVK